MTIDLSRVQCISCSGALIEGHDAILRCRGCAREYPILDGIPALMFDATRDTALDLAQYEAQHPPDPDQGEGIFRPYRDAMRRFGVAGGVCLEIGSGTGNLTRGLAGCADLTEIHCFDISLRFLRRLLQYVPRHEKLRCWIFDAAHSPFRAESVNAVFGHSVLHHLLDYEDALRDVFRVLRPGGLAMFGEPIMDSHAMTSFCAGLIVAIEQRNGLAGLSEPELSILRDIRDRCGFVGKSMRENRQALAGLESKHVFVVGDLLRLAREIGYREADYVNGFTPDRIGDDHRHRIGWMLTYHGFSDEKLDPYGFVFNELSETYGAAMAGAAAVNFGYFMFRK